MAKDVVGGLKAVGRGLKKVFGRGGKKKTELSNKMTEASRPAGEMSSPRTETVLDSSGPQAGYVPHKETAKREGYTKKPAAARRRPAGQGRTGTSLPGPKAEIHEPKASVSTTESFVAGPGLVNLEGPPDRAAAKARTAKQHEEATKRMASFRERETKRQPSSGREASIGKNRPSYWRSNMMRAR